MRFTRFAAASALVGGLHFALSALVVPLTLLAGEALAAGRLRDAAMGVLVGATKVLYTPLMALGLYPRHWFPGGWIYVPIGANSLLWGLTLAGLHYLLRRPGRPPA